MKWTSTRLWTSLLADFLFLVFSQTSTAAQRPGTFIPTGNMTTPRIFHTATLLLSGKVLITGGFDQPWLQGTKPTRLASAELFNPETGAFTPTGNMTTGRASHSATLLADGRVLIAGGDENGLTTTAELYDPSTGTFTATANLLTVQFGYTATLLNDGKVLLSGGEKSLEGCPDSIVADPEVYDPVTDTFSATGDYAEKTRPFANLPRCLGYGLAGAPATLLSNGRVLIASEPTAELYAHDTGTFSLTGQNTGPRGFYGRTITLLTNGKVLLTGGDDDFGPHINAQLYDSSTEQFTVTGNMTTPRSDHTATLLRDGTVLIAGSQLFPGVLASTELYDPATASFHLAGDMIMPRFFHTATLLLDGRILIAGGFTSWPTTPNSDSAELYIPSVLVPAQVVADLRFDRTSVVTGSSYSVNVSGSNLTPQTFFDVRFTAPGSNASDVILNWQRGVAASHEVPVGIAAGTWTINGVRAHVVETDHTGIFFPVSATIRVSP
jgi:galactose oxidase-like protein